MKGLEAAMKHNGGMEKEAITNPLKLIFDKDYRRGVHEGMQGFQADGGTYRDFDQMGWLAKRRFANQQGDIARAKRKKVERDSTQHHNKILDKIRGGGDKSGRSYGDKGKGKGGGKGGGGGGGGYINSQRHLDDTIKQRDKLLSTTATLGGGLAGGFLGRHIGGSLDNAYNRATGKGSKKGEEGTRVGRTVGSLAGTGLGAMAGNALKDNIWNTYNDGNFQLPFVGRNKKSSIDKDLIKVASYHNLDPNLLKKKLV